MGKPPDLINSNTQIYKLTRQEELVVFQSTKQNKQRLWEIKGVLKCSHSLDPDWQLLSQEPVLASQLHVIESDLSVQVAVF